MVQAIINQRDMYRTLLAQATPLPGDSPAGRSLSAGRRGIGGEEVDTVSVFQSPREAAVVGHEAEEARKELEELREQFEAYKKEKLKNDCMLQEQLDKMRDESSEIKIHNVKLGSKVSGDRVTLSMHVVASVGHNMKLGSKD